MKGLVRVLAFEPPGHARTLLIIDSRTTRSPQLTADCPPGGDEGIARRGAHRFASGLSHATLDSGKHNPVVPPREPHKSSRLASAVEAWSSPDGW